MMSEAKVGDATERKSAAFPAGPRLSTKPATTWRDAPKGAASWWWMRMPSRASCTPKGGPPACGRRDRGHHGAGPRRPRCESRGRGIGIPRLQERPSQRHTKLPRGPPSGGAGACPQVVPAPPSRAGQRRGRLRQAPEPGPVPRGRLRSDRRDREGRRQRAPGSRPG